MELYDKLNILEEKTDKLIKEIQDLRSEKDKAVLDYNELLARFDLIESELEQAKRDKDAVRDRIENLINKLG